MVGFLQFYTMRKQAQILDKSLIETRKTAHAAKDSAEVASRMLQANRAPVLDITPVMVCTTPIQSSTVYFEVHNSGQTSAEIKEQNFHAWYHDLSTLWPPERPFDDTAQAIKPLPERLESHATMQDKLQVANPT